MANARRPEDDMSSDRYREIMESSADWSWEVDLDGAYTYSSPHVRDIIGYEPEEVIGKTPFDFMPPGPAEHMRDHFARVIADAIPTDSVENVKVHKDGHLVWTEARGTLVRDAEGNVVAFRGIDRDITKRKLAEEALRKSEAQFRAVYDSSPLGILLTNNTAGGLIVDANRAACEMLGHDLETLTSMAMPHIIHPEDLQRNLARFEAINSDPHSSSLDIELRMMRADGTPVWCEVHGTIMRSERDEPTFGLALMTDITERKRADEDRRRLEAQVQHAQKLESLGVLAGGIAHDFNNLLMSMLGNADLALCDLPATSPARDRLGDIETAARRAADLCRQMLAYSGKGRFVIESLDLHRVIHEMSRMLEVSISKRAVLKFNFADGLPGVEADATQIRQVIMNLITNASEALAEKSGVISISTGAMDCDRSYLRETYLDEDLPEGHYVYLEVADTGCGMDEVTRARMFEPFFTTKFTGRGLGMAAVLGIVRGHRGAIKVYSEPRKGTTVKVLLPASDQQPPNDGDGEHKDALRATGAILLVDDEESVRAVAGRMLARLGFEVITAVDGRDALEKYRENLDSISCVLLDLTMPHLDGEEAFRELRRITKDVRVILSSGYNEQDVIQRFAGKGLTGFIQKPYQLAKLREVLRTVFGSYCGE